MFSKLATAASLLLVARGVSAITISTPSTVPQCGELTFDIGEAQGPVFFSVVPGQNPCEQDALFESTEISGGQYKWTAAYPVGTQFFAYVDDESEAEAWSGLLTVTEGDDACLTSASPSSSSSTSTRTQLVVGDDDEEEVTPPTSRTRTTVPTSGGGGSGVENVAEGIETNGNGALSRASVSITAVLAAGLVAFTL